MFLLGVKFLLCAFSAFVVALIAGSVAMYLGAAEFIQQATFVAAFVFALDVMTYDRPD